MTQETSILEELGASPNHPVLRVDSQELTAQQRITPIDRLWTVWKLDQFSGKTSGACSESKNEVYIWWFPEIGVPPNHPFLDRIFHEINHPFWGTPNLGKPHLTCCGKKQLYLVQITIWGPLSAPHHSFVGTADSPTSSACSTCYTSTS